MSRISTRVFNEAQYLIYHKSTLRVTAKHFGVSKSTVHLDLTRRIEKLYPNLHRLCREIAAANLAARASRGGKVSAQLRYGTK